MTPFEKLTVELTVAGLLLAALSFLTTVFASEVRQAFISAWSWCKQLRLPRPKFTAWRVTTFSAALLIGGISLIFLQYEPSKPIRTTLRNQSPSTSLSTASTNQQTPSSIVVKGVKFVRIPAGNADIGCTVDDEQCTRNELPFHRVSIPKAFWMAATEVTIFQFETCVKQGHCNSPSGEPLMQHAGTEKLPITWVAAEDAQQFCRWLGGDLPTETEWEYAARGRLRSCRYPWGKSASQREARYRTGAGIGVAAVGSFPPNDYGLYDMAGNVSEFSLGAVSSNGQPFVILRGGSYETGSDRIRVSARTLTDWGFAGATIGFRCVIRTK